ncbi:testis development-related protein isoform X3 [Emydura macquarii macquarii]|uniref:testis development-related protein isoform X3 n=1 Tax=Emydura macquarii macquarii TaxID=1129001 RepID=UPI00352A718A
MSEAGRSRAGCRGDQKARVPHPAASYKHGSGRSAAVGRGSGGGRSQNKDQFLHDEVTSSVSQLATKVQSASFRGWKEVTSMFNKDDEQQLLAECKSPKSKGTNLKLKEDVKSEKKSGFWDSLAIKQNIQSRKPDEIEGWEPPQITAGDPISDAGNTLSDYSSWSGWEDETKGSTKYTNLASSGNSSRWSIKSAGKLVSIRRQSKGNLTDNWEELE